MQGPLSAADYAAGLQCDLRLWRQRRPAPADPPGEPADPDEAVLREGARALFAGGSQVLGSDLSTRAAHTRALLDLADTSSIFDAVVACEQAQLRVDVLERLSPGVWGLRLLRCRARVLDTDLDELALAYHLAGQVGLEIGSAQVLHPDPGYALPPGGAVWDELLRRVEVRDEVAFLAQDVAAELERLRALDARESAPVVEPSPHCRRPAPCAFSSRCHRELPRDWIGFLPGLRVAHYQALRERGLVRVADIPSDFPVTRVQRQAREALTSGERIVREEVLDELASWAPRCDFLDFEAIAAAVPVFPGTRPFEALPYLWSHHRLEADGRLRHRDWLGGTDDPRPELAAALCASLGPDDVPIVVYSSFERQIIEALAEALPAQAAPLRSLLPRLRDLQGLIRRGVYDPELRGSFSLKQVAPALVEGFEYADLGDLADGAAAARGLGQIARGQVHGTAADRLAARLRRYCARDTLALVEIVAALRGDPKPPVPLG